MKTKKHYKRHYKQTKKNKIKKQNVTRKYRKRGGARTTQAQRDARTAKTEAEVVKKHGAELLKVKRTKPLTKKQRDLEAKETAAKTAAEVAVTVAVDNEIIPIIEENATKEAKKQAPYVNPDKIKKNILDFTSIIAESAKKAANSTLGVAIKNKFKAKPKQEPPPPQQDINVYDIMEGTEKTSREFFEEHKNDNPFILVSMIENNQKKLYSGNAIGWAKDNKEFVECKDDTPVGWQGNAYQRYIKPGGRRFIKAYLGGAPIMLLKPSWFDSGKVPGDKFFTLVSAKPVFKLMSLELATGINGDFDAQGANHCNQTGTQVTYALEGEQQNTVQHPPPAELDTTTETNPPAAPNTKGTKPVTKPIIVTKPKTKPIKTTDPGSVTTEEVAFDRQRLKDEEKQRLENEARLKDEEKQRLENEEKQRLEDEARLEDERLRQEKENEKERQRLEDEEQEKAAIALSLEQEQEQAEASSPKEKKVSRKKSPSARPPSPEYRYSSSSYNKPNSYALLAAPRYKNYFSDASDKPNSYALLNSRRNLSGEGKSRHTSRKQRIK